MVNEDEMPLTGGHLTEVVRVGETVRRPVRPYTETIHALLRHLERCGFDGAPRAYGIDDEGREILEYIPGEVASGRPPGYVWSDAVLVALGSLVRSFHAASGDFDPPRDAVWQGSPHPAYPVEIICHNDLAPWNTVFREQRPVAFIDWDWAAPGARIWDVAFVLWQWIPLIPQWRREQVGAPTELDWRHRARIFCGSYGLNVAPGDLLEVIADRQHATYVGLRDEAEAGDPAHVRLWREAREGLEAEMAFVRDLAGTRH